MTPIDTNPNAKPITGNFKVDRLDTTTVNVYSGGTNAVIVVVDPLKKWTWDFATKEIEKIPFDLHVLLVINHHDRHQHRVVTRKEIDDWMNFQDHPLLRAVEASMLNCYGMKAIVSFLNMPFLQ